MEVNVNIKPTTIRFEQNAMSAQNMWNYYLLAKDCIPEAVLIYICALKQWDPLGRGILDPREFAKVFQFSEKYILDKHEDPLQRRLKMVSQDAIDRDKKSRKADRAMNWDIICDSRLENALFILTTVPLSGIATNVDEEHNYLVRSYKPIRPLEEFMLIQERTTGRVVIQYKMSEIFRNNLSTLFREINITSTIKLRKSRLTSLYYYMVEIRGALYARGLTSTTPEFTPSFERLKKIAGITDEEPRFAKRNLKNAFDKIKKETELDFDIEWIKTKDEKNKYTIIIHFNPEIGDDLAIPINKRVIGVRKDLARIDIIAIEFRHRLVALCPVRYEPFEDNGKEFFKWLKNLGPNEIKTVEKILIQCFVTTGNTVPSQIGLQQRMQLFQNCIRTKKPEEFETWTKELFSGELSPIPNVIIQPEKPKDNKEF